MSCLNSGCTNQISGSCAVLCARKKLTSKRLDRIDALASLSYLLLFRYSYLLSFDYVLSETSGKLGTGGMLVSLWAEIRLVQIN